MKTSNVTYSTLIQLIYISLGTLVTFIKKKKNQGLMDTSNITYSALIQLIYISLVH